MNYFYVFLFLLSSTISAATASGQPLLESSEREGELQLVTGRSRASSVVSGTPSVASYVTLTGGRMTEYAVPDISNLSTEEMIHSFLQLAGEYKKLLKSCKKTNTNVSNFLKEQIGELDAIPGAIEQSEAQEGKSETLRNGIKNLVRMYKELESQSRLRKTSPDSSLTAESSSAERVTELETTIATLTAGTAELEETVAQLQQRPETAEAGTTFSPERHMPFSSPARLKATAETVTRQAVELETLRADVQRLNDENTQLRSRQLAVDMEVAAKDDAAVRSLQAELERLQAENAELKRAQKDAAQSKKPRAVAGNRPATESTPLATGYVPLDGTAAINAGGEKKGQGCPCSVM